MKKIDVCLSPELIHLYDLKDKVVVVVDVLRATTCMVTALANGVKKIRAYADLDTCRSMRRSGFIIAGERGGQKVSDFDLGNSPLAYLNDAYLGEQLAVTTTNGTLAIDKSKHAKEVIIGAMVNLDAVANYLNSQKRDVLVFCAGWKGKVNMEDTLFAGALVELLEENFESECDAPQIAQMIYQNAKEDIIGYLKNASHVKRLSGFDIEEDIHFCLTPNKYNIVPVLLGEDLVIKQ
jgi:2-phosphosulfolactate phosphatase